MPERLRAFGGGPLAGDKIVRQVFFDEAGTSRPEEEPFLVVAGVAIHADSQWKVIEEYLWSLIVEYFPRERWAGAYLHAHKLYQGRSPFADSEGWPEERRHEVLERLCRIPQRFDLPILYFYQDRAQIADRPPTEWIKDKTQEAHVTALMGAMMQAEAYMRLGPAKDELASIILEDAQHIQRYVKDAYRALRSATPSSPDTRDRLPLTRIVGTPHFEEKQDVSLLQVADACAYVIKRQFMRDPNIERFFGPMRRKFPFANDIDPSDPLYKPWESASD